MSLIQAEQMRKDIKVLTVFKQQLMEYRTVTKNPIEHNALTKKIKSTGRDIRRTVDRLMELHNSGHDLD